MSDRTAWNLTLMIVIGLLVQLAVIGYVFYSGYARRIEAIGNQRAACERIKLDRRSNAKGWRIAQEARDRSGDVDVAAQYEQVAEDLEVRAKISCTEAFPNPTLFP